MKGGSLSLRQLFERVPPPNFRAIEAYKIEQLGVSFLKYSFEYEIKKLLSTINKTKQK